jgi:hypothetical protein
MQITALASKEITDSFWSKYEKQCLYTKIQLPQIMCSTMKVVALWKWLYEVL